MTCKTLTCLLTHYLCNFIVAVNVELVRVSILKNFQSSKSAISPSYFQINICNPKGGSRVSCKQTTSLSAIAVLFSLTAAVPPVVAQSTSSNTSFPLPKNVPNGTVVRVNSSSSMAKINEALAKKFQNQYSGANVKVSYADTNAALKAVLDGKSDLAGISRPLTNAEKAQGLIAIPISRHKIAMFVSQDNPWKGGLTINQFAQMFRGELTNWSQVGGKTGKIRVIDRPNISDTRQAFEIYPVFQKTALKTGANVVQLKQDSTDAVIQALGKDGIGYAIADQVVTNPKLRVVAMHKVAPTDGRYPFSQPLMYVYQGTKPNPTAQAFLGYATATENQQIVEKARQESATSTTVNSGANNATTTNNSTNSRDANPGNTNSGNTATSISVAQNSPGNVANTNDADSEFPWWLLLIPFLGGLLWWVMKGIDSPAAAPPVVSVTESSGKSRLFLTPRNSNEGYAYWEIPESLQGEWRRQGKRGMKLRIYDVTNVDDADLQNQTLVGEYNCPEEESGLHLGIPATNRDYAAEIGYDVNDDQWLKVARSQRVHVPAFLENNALTSEEELQASSLWNDVNVATQKTTSIPESNTIIANTDINTDTNIFPDFSGATAATIAALGGTSLLGFFGKNRPSEATNPATDTSQVILVPRTADSAYAYWELSPAQEEELHSPADRKLFLKLYDTTDVDLDTQALAAIQEYECNLDHDFHLSIPASDRHYLVEIGYIQDDGSWLQIAYSEPVRVSSTMTELSGSHSPSALSTEAIKVVANDLVSSISHNEPANSAANLTESRSRSFSDWIGETTKTLGNKLAASTAAVTGVGIGTHALFEKTGLSPHADNPETSEKTTIYPHTTKRQCQIILVPRNSKDAYAYWEVSEDYKQVARNQGGSKFALRVHDATNLDIDTQEPHATQEYFCNESEFDQHIAIPLCDRDYIAEVGYYTLDNRWIRIIRSFHVRVPM
ncbi:ABC-type phosphate transport system periplasmic component-like protein [Calothrix sp. NIES-4101]|nr:ABC-type phosphate transport system periplasmic component-like protein [Calothrix sp. NIES-4101]